MLALHLPFHMLHATVNTEYSLSPSCNPKRTVRALFIFLSTVPHNLLSLLYLSAKVVFPQAMLTQTDDESLREQAKEEAHTRADEVLKKEDDRDGDEIQYLKGLQLVSIITAYYTSLSPSAFKRTELC